MTGELSTYEKIKFLSAVSLFPGLDYEQREKMASVVKSNFYSVDSYICKKGKAGDSMYLIVEGTVRLEVDGLPVRAQRGKGECIGEMALTDNQPRSASLRAATDVQLLRLDSDQIEAHLIQDPQISRKLFNVLNTRLRDGLSIQVDSIRQQAAREKELPLAADVQASLFPKQEIQLSDFHTAGYCQAAQSVGGDYYDYLDLGSDRIGIIVVDAVGHGFHSALFTALVKSCLQTQTSYTGAVPSVVKRIQTTVDQAESGLYLTMCYIIFDLASRTLTYTNAGHPFPIHYRSRTGQLDTLESTCMPLGLVQGIPLPPRYFRRISWDAGDTFLIYSDGVTEATDAVNEEFGEKRLHDVFLSHVHRPIEEIKTAILEELKLFTDATPQSDDVTLVLVRC